VNSPFTDRPAERRNIEPMRIGLSLPSSTRFTSALGNIPVYEAAGLDIVWVGESY